MNEGQKKRKINKGRKKSRKEMKGRQRNKKSRNVGSRKWSFFYAVFICNANTSTRNNNTNKYILRIEITN